MASGEGKIDSVRNGERTVRNGERTVRKSDVFYDYAEQGLPDGDLDMDYNF